MLYSKPVDDTLQTEMAVYWRQLPTYHEHEGEYVVMQGETPLGFYPDLETALEAGYEKYGFGPFLVKRVVMDELIDPALSENDVHAERPAFEQHSS